MYGQGLTFVGQQRLCMVKVGQHKFCKVKAGYRQVNKDYVWSRLDLGRSTQIMYDQGQTQVGQHKLCKVKAETQVGQRGLCMAKAGPRQVNTDYVQSRLDLGNMVPRHLLFLPLPSLLLSKIRLTSNLQLSEKVLPHLTQKLITQILKNFSKIMITS